MRDDLREKLIFFGCGMIGFTLGNGLAAVALGGEHVSSALAAVIVTAGFWLALPICDWLFSMRMPYFGSGGGGGSSPAAGSSEITEAVADTVASAFANPPTVSKDG
jgi:hypothetical protein